MEIILRIPGVRCGFWFRDSYFVITPHATRSPEFPDGSVL
jgi:hypothetical protein